MVMARAGWPRRLVEVVQRFVEADSWAAARVLAEREPRLVTDAADGVLTDLIAQARGRDDEAWLRTFTEHRDVLRRCRSDGLHRLDELIGDGVPELLRERWVEAELAYERYRRQPTPDRMDAALRAAGAVVGQPASADPTTGPRCRATVNLAAALRERGTPAELRRAAGLLTGVLEAPDPDADLRAIAATNLGHVESDRFLASADPAHLDLAERAYRIALEHTTPRSPRLPARRAQLAAVGVERWRFGGGPAVLDRAVALLEQAVAESGRAPAPAVAVHNLGTALGERFELRGDLRDLDRAISLLADPPGSDAGNLAALLGRRYEATGDADDLARLDLLRATSGSGVPARFEDERQRAAALLTLHEHRGQAADLDSAVAAAATAVARAGPVRRPSALVNLGTAISARYSETGVVADLERAVDAYREALAATPPGSPRRELRLANLGDALREKAHRFGRLADLDQAVELLAAALKATPVGAAGRSFRLSALANAVFERHRRRRRSDDLQAARELARAALEHTPPGAPDRASRLGLLAACRHQDWREGGDPAALDEAIDAYRTGLAETPAAAPVRLRHQQNLANCLADRSRGTDRAEAEALFRAVLERGSDRDPWAAAAAAHNWAAAAARWQDWPAAASAYLRGFALVSTLVAQQRLRRHQEGWLRDAQQLPAGAAVAALRLGRPDQAVVILEAGRGVLLAGTIER